MKLFQRILIGLFILSPFPSVIEKAIYRALQKKRKRKKKTSGREKYGSHAETRGDEKKPHLLAPAAIVLEQYNEMIQSQQKPRIKPLYLKKKNLFMCYLVIPTMLHADS